MTNMPGVQLSQRGSRKVIVAVVVVLAVILVALIGAEFYARHHAASLVADAVQCEARDTADVSFSAAPPVLLQYLGGHYSKISVQTAGNQVRNAKGMKVDLTISDIHVQHTADSKGSIGSLDGTITWSSDGIKQSIQDAVPVLGSVITSSVTTSPGDGTVQLKGLLDSATLKPRVVDNGLSLQVVSLSALGQHLQADSVQHDLDNLTSRATQNYPLGIHVDSVQVTDTDVVVKFSSQNATIPASSSQDSCFDQL